MSGFKGFGCTHVRVWFDVQTLGYNTRQKKPDLEDYHPMTESSRRKRISNRSTETNTNTTSQSTSSSSEDYERSPRTPRYETASTSRSKSRDRSSTSSSASSSTSRRSTSSNAGGASSQRTRYQTANTSSKGRSPQSAATATKTAKGTKEKEPGFLTRVARNWWDRLISATFGGKFAEQSAQYLAHQTQRDYVCNAIGQACWSGLFPLLAIIVTWVLGTEEAGYLTMASTIGLLFYLIAIFGMRAYQVSDIDELSSFYDYQLSRVLTVAIMLALGILFCNLRYEGTMRATCIGVLLFRAVDAFSEVYEGRLEQKDKLYLAGLSQACRCILAGVIFIVVLLFTRDLGIASYSLVIGAVIVMLLLTIPLAYFETDHSLPLSLRSVGSLLSQCWPIFIAVFVDELINAVPRFVMEEYLTYENQLIYNVFPDDMIVTIAGLVYRPQLSRLSHIWDDPSKRKKFDVLVIAMIGVIALVTGLLAVFQVLIGVRISTLIYGIDFTQYSSLVVIMVISGGLCACVDFLTQIIAILRAQHQVTRLYIIAFAFSVPITILLVSYSQLAGAVSSRLVTMAILLLLLVNEYISIHRKAAQEY